MKRELERIKRERIEKREKEVRLCGLEDCLWLGYFADGTYRNESELRSNRKPARRILRLGIPC